MLSKKSMRTKKQQWRNKSGPCGTDGLLFVDIKCKKVRMEQSASNAMSIAFL